MCMANIFFHNRRQCREGLSVQQPPCYFIPAICHPRNLSSGENMKSRLARCRYTRGHISSEIFLTSAEKQSSARIEGVCQYSTSAFGGVWWMQRDDWRRTASDEAGKEKKRKENYPARRSRDSHQPFNFLRAHPTDALGSHFALRPKGETDSLVSIAQSRFIEPGAKRWGAVVQYAEMRFRRIVTISSYYPT